VCHSADHKPIVEDVDSAGAALGIFDYPSCWPTSPIRLKPRIEDEMGNRQDASCRGDLSHGGRNESEGRAEPGKRQTWYTERVRNRLIAPDQVRLELVDVPQISEPVAERVIYQKMAGSRNRPSLFRPACNLAANEAKARFDFEVVQNRQQVVGDPSGGSVVEGKQAMAGREATLRARNKDRIEEHALHTSARAQNRSRPEVIAGSLLPGMRKDRRRGRLGKKQRRAEFDFQDDLERAGGDAAPSVRLPRYRMESVFEPIERPCSQSFLSLLIVLELVLVLDFQLSKAESGCGV
jgi:hypothetical protein